mmetsp:Transcript_48476/g.89910  ORF Transcript_48476/g.89910 Transcript_48476/m.89910 type:complete len:223 (-) Transcript_48476:176-844(-)
MLVSTVATPPIPARAGSHSVWASSVPFSEHLVLRPSQVLPDVGLVQHHVRARIQLSTRVRALRRHAEPQRHVRHAQYHHSRVPRRPLRNARHPVLGDVVAVQERHFRIGLDPHLVLRVLRQVIQRGDSQSKLAGLGELAQTRSEVQEVVPADRRGGLHLRFGRVVHSILHEAEAVPFVGPVDESFDGPADVLGQLEEDGFGLLFGERSHDGGSGGGAAPVYF